MVWSGSSSSWWTIPFSSHHHLPWRQYGFCNRLWSRASTTIFFTHYCRTWSTFHRPLSFVSKMARFRFVSAAIHKWKFGPFNFSLLIHVEPKYRGSFGIQSFVNGSKLFYGRCLVLWRCREVKYVGLPRFFKEFHRLFQWLTGQGEVHR